MELIKKYLSKNKNIYNLLVFFYNLPKIIYYYFFLLIFSIFKIKNKKIIVINREGMGYWDMGKYICNELVKDNYEIFWPCKNEYINTLPSDINFVKYDSIIYLYHLATAKIRINNCGFPLWIRKRKEQFYIQTWHGCIWFKKVWSAIEEKLSKYSILSGKCDAKMINTMISNSDFCTNIFKNYFWYNGEILEYGCPRNDIIINKNKNLIKKVRKYLSIWNDEKICLYAPTFRKDNSLNSYNINYKALVNELEKKFKWKWKILLRLHPSLSNQSQKILGFGSDVINVTDYPDIQELLLASDFMITDYSSCVFDYALTYKPALIYASDIEEYKKERDFFVNIDDTPFPIATNNNELITIVKSFNINKYQENVRIYYQKMWLNETGNSCKKIAEMVYFVTNGRKFEY